MTLTRAKMSLRFFFVGKVEKDTLRPVVSPEYTEQGDREGALALFPRFIRESLFNGSPLALFHRVQERFNVHRR